jgi:phosphoenolpyruvate carboxylase
MLANTIDGVGQAAAGHAERFRFMLLHSPRFRRTMAMVEAAMMCSDPDVLGAYIETFAPGMWLNRSGRTRNPVRREELRIIAAQFETGNIHARLGNVFRRLHADYLSLRDALADGVAAGMGVGSAGPDAEDREEMALLHALRIAVLHRIYLLASHIPDFTPHQGMTRDDLLQRILHLDIESSVERLGEIFPRSDALTVAGLDFAEPATYARDVAQTYEQEHEAIFAPMATYFTLTRRIGAAITHRIGAIG